MPIFAKLIICINFIWIGFVSAISFMEAWLKFRAVGMTMKLGVAVGQLVFQALNKVELACATIMLGALIFSKPTLFKLPDTIFFCIALTILALQTFWLLPILDRRASLIIQGQSLEEQYYHVVFVICEVLKVGCLLVYGLKLLKNNIL